MPLVEYIAWERHFELYPPTLVAELLAMYMSKMFSTPEKKYELSDILPWLKDRKTLHSEQEEMDSVLAGTLR